MTLTKQEAAYRMEMDIRDSGCPGFPDKQDLAKAYDEAIKYGDDSVCVKMDYEVNFSVDTVAAYLGAIMIDAVMADWSDSDGDTVKLEEITRNDLNTGDEIVMSSGIDGDTFEVWATATVRIDDEKVWTGDDAYIAGPKTDFLRVIR